MFGVLWDNPEPWKGWNLDLSAESRKKPRALSFYVHFLGVTVNNEPS